MAKILHRSVDARGGRPDLASSRAGTLLRMAGWWLLPAALSVGSSTTVRAETLKEVDLPAFQAQIRGALSLTEACAAAGKDCDPTGLPATEQVKGPGDAEAFQVEWEWLGDALGAAKAQAAPQRIAAMQAAARQLTEMDVEASGRETAGAAGPVRAKEGSASSFEQARAAANAVLAGAEFQTAAGPTWIDRQVARVQDWFFRLLMGMDRMGSRNPWLAPAIEWTCFLLAAGGLVFFVRRSLQRQALRIALGEVAVVQRTGLDPTAWAAQAEAQAGAEEWREAVHCLYWAAIAVLEARRAWRPNPTRTPREYVALLRPGSKAQDDLRELTRVFERVWYGQKKATKRDFEAAGASFAGIQAARLRDKDSGVEDAPGGDDGSGNQGSGKRGNGSRGSGSHGNGSHGNGGHGNAPAVSAGAA